MPGSRVKPLNSWRRVRLVASAPPQIWWIVSPVGYCVMTRRIARMVDGLPRSISIHCSGSAPEFQMVSGFPSIAFEGGESGREAEAVTEAGLMFVLSGVEVPKGERVGQSDSNPAAQDSTFPSIIV